MNHLLIGDDQVLLVYNLEAAMLAEIYLLRLEALARGSEEATLAESSRFVPLDPASVRRLQTRQDGKQHLAQRA